MFESLDDDRFERASQPVYFKMQGKSINNRLNAFRVYDWDGFYN